MNTPLRTLPTRRAGRLLAAASLTALALGGLAACGGDGATEAVDASSTSDADESGACTYDESGPAAEEVDLPPATPAVSGEVPATIETSAGTIDLTLDADADPCTVNSFVSLAEQGYFDGTTCHRLTTAGIYVLQCGDPTGTGSGGPGYSFADETTGEESYDAGTLAMANAGPDTNGSQFFLVYGDSPLPPSYTVFGSVGADGLSTIEKVARDGVAGGAQDGPPASPVDIDAVEVG